MRRLTLITNPDKCNLRCPLCFLNQRGFSRYTLGVGEMSYETARAAIEKYAAERDASGNRVLWEVIPSTMGEPLLYSHFDELQELCRELEIPLNLTTNGTFPGKWGGESGMAALLQSCSDIKVSFLASECFNGWKSNVEKLLNVRHRLIAKMADVNVPKIATVSVQVTLHRKNLKKIPELVQWATSMGIDRIKWNPVVFLNVAAENLRDEFALNYGLDNIRDSIINMVEACGGKVKNGGSLFMRLPQGRFSKANGTCPFAGEVWILPDGTEDFCPSPERRYGDRNAECCFIK